MKSAPFPSAPRIRPTRWARQPRLREAGALSLVAIGLLVGAPPAQASDASLRRALRSYETRLAADIGYLSSFTMPTRSRAPAVLRRLSSVRTDLNGATGAAERNRASTGSGRVGRAQVLSALHYAITATIDAQLCASAARVGNRARARRDARAEQRAINQAIPLFEAGGKRLHLF